MAERQQKVKPSTPETETEQVEVDEPVTERGDELRAELDDQLDAIADVLEANDEDFVKSYVQKGGE